MTDVNDVTMIVFDLRIFQQELQALNTPTQAFQDLVAQQNIDSTQGLGGE